jgi:hypothetical protein
MADIAFYSEKMRVIDRFRRHRFITKHIVDRTPGLYATENEPIEEKAGRAKWFSPTFTWFMCELDPETGEAFGYVENLSEPAFSEWGYFNLREMGEVFVGGPGLPVYIERDLYYDGRIPGQAEEG